MKSHTYSVDVGWTGDRGTGTDGYGNYGRDRIVYVAGKLDFAGSAVAAASGVASASGVAVVADESMCSRAEGLHAKASAKCFIAGSVNFPVRYRGTTVEVR